MVNWTSSKLKTSLPKVREERQTTFAKHLVLQNLYPEYLKDA
jgi:hypothetical protein